jgi:hypothetical protein
MTGILKFQSSTLSNFNLFSALSSHSTQFPLKRHRFVNPFLISSLQSDYAQEQEMEIEALEAILMDEFKGIIMFIYAI